MTNQIVISDISIHKDAHGRYSLNDLHKASGKEDKHQPAFFMRRNETIEMIEVISNSAKSQSYKPVISKSGRYGGTYVCKELVYSYAMWISAAFALKVIRAYDALVSSVMPKQASIQLSTAKELIPLRQTAERLIAHGVGNIYPDIWKHVHAEFGVQHINELLPEQIPLAISYLDALEGEYIPKQEAQPKQTEQFVNCRVLQHYDNKGAIVKSEVAADDEQLTSPKVFADLAESRGYVMVKKNELKSAGMTDNELSRLLVVRNRFDKGMKLWKKHLCSNLISMNVPSAVPFNQMVTDALSELRAITDKISARFIA